MPSNKKKDLIDLYTHMVKVRHVEETLMEVFSGGEIPGFLHVCVGQEAAPAAVCSLLTTDDYIGSTHRSHGHAVAKGIDLKLFMAELLGKKNGFCMGRSGSMHIADKNLGILGANGIVGGGIPIATGAAFAAKRKYPGRVAVAFFGDGATSQGNFHECLNMAAVWKLPIIFVCENNGWAEFSPQDVHMTIKDIAKRAAGYDIPGVVVSNEVLEIQEAADKAIKLARKGGGPTFIEVKCNRWHGHFVGDPQKYRGKEAVSEAMKDDCLKRFEAELLKQKALDKETVAKIDEQIRKEVTEAVEFARNSSVPDPSELAQGLYV